MALSNFSCTQGRLRCGEVPEKYTVANEYLQYISTASVERDLAQATRAWATPIDNTTYMKWKKSTKICCHLQPTSPALQKSWRASMSTFSLCVGWTLCRSPSWIPWSSVRKHEHTASFTALNTPGTLQRTAEGVHNAPPLPPLKAARTCGPSIKSKPTLLRNKRYSNLRLLNSLSTTTTGYI